MRVERLRLRDFRTYATADVAVGPGLTVLHGPNGAGKTNLLEALYFGCTARSCRTANERDMVRFDAPAARVEVDTSDRDGAHTLSVGFQPGEPKRIKVDGAPVERLTDSPARPLVSVFLPDRLELVKGAPSLRRAHLDQLVAALWPARAGNRAQYSRAMAQRNALLGRVRAGRVGEVGARCLGRGAVALGHRAARRSRRGRGARRRGLPAAGRRAGAGRRRGGALPAADARPSEPAELAAELLERRASDVERGFTQHGPHRDELLLLRDGRELKSFGSQGEQRLALLALLLAERAVLTEERGAPPLMLLDDVMSELDADRRGMLVARLGRRRPGRGDDDRPRPRAGRAGAGGRAPEGLAGDGPAGCRVGGAAMSQYRTANESDHAVS